MSITFKTLWVIGLILSLNSVFAQQTVLEIGDKVMHFEAKTDDGKLWKSKTVLGKKNVVIYFYPAAMTGGCTKQACAYRDDKSKLEELNAVVLGVSGDEVRSLKLFKESHNLNFTLLSDSEGKIANSFGVPVRKGVKTIEREINGNTYQLTRNLTTSRWTFVINKEGELVYKSTSVKAADDSNMVIEVLKGL